MYVYYPQIALYLWRILIKYSNTVGLRSIKHSAKVANEEVKAYMETVFTKATIVVDSTLAE